MRIALLHGYELTGSGSNEYCRYLSRALARRGHEVHLLCREPHPEAVAHVSQAIAWDEVGGARELFERDPGEGVCVVHQLPHAPVRPVYLTDKQRAGDVKAFVDLTDKELEAYHALNVAVVRAIVRRHPVDLLHANHLVWQPSVAAAAGVPFIVYPHGSSIEYTLKADARYLRHAGDALAAAAGIISGSDEVLQRILALYPEHREALLEKSVIVGVGVDTALFAPVEPGARRASVARLSGAHGGKTRAQHEALLARLTRGDWNALSDYHEAYDHGAPDADLEAKLRSIPWDDGQVCLFVGALTAGKGVHNLIAAWPALLPAHLIVVGSGAYREVLEALVHAIAAGDQALYAHLRAHGFDLDRSGLRGGWDALPDDVAACAPLTDHVHFAGRLDHDRLRHLFPCADLAVFPSVVPEAYPLVLMESLANGVLPVVSDFSGFRDGLAALEPHLGADLVAKMRLPVGDVAGIVAALRELLPCPPRGDELRKVAVEQFDWDVRAQEMVEAYARFVP
ncbi:MAG: glycosyltransferase family 4 protein [Planctomycetota bacterium]